MSNSFPVASNCVGIDVGGANIKLSDGKLSQSIPFPLWKQPEKLLLALQEALSHYPHCQRIAATMTGELADCFQTKADGVSHILNAIRESARSKELLIWQTGGEFFSVEEAYEFPLLVAAANWHALATWAGRIQPQGQMLLVDIGSTTTDLIPIENGLPMTMGNTDVERLGSGELLYLGSKRTPLCALTNAITVKEMEYPLAKELFATTYDVGILSGYFSEDRDSCETANGRPATIPESRHRIARAFCGDIAEFDDDFIEQAVAAFLNIVVSQLADGLKTVSARIEPATLTFLTCGEGEFLAKMAIERAFSTSNFVAHSLSKFGSEALSISACAYALSVLGSEQPQLEWI